MSSTAYTAADLIIPNNAGVKSGVLQAWRPKAKLLEDITFSQNTANGSRVNQSGEIEFVANNIPRWNWPIGGGCPKILLEPQRTQNLLDSNEFGSWNKVNTGTGVAPTVTENYGAHLGRSTSRVQCSVGSLDNDSRSYISKDYTGFAGDVTQSIYIRSLSGTVTLTVLGPSANDTTVTTAWQRLKLTNPIGDSVRIGLLDTGGATPSASIDIEVHDAQVEKGLKASSIIEATTAIKTRNKDVYTFANLVGSGYLSATEGTVFLKLKSEALFRDSASVFLSIGSSGNRFIIFNGTSSFTRPKITVENSNGSEDYLLLTDDSKIAITWDATGSIISVNGSTVLTSTKAPDLTANSDLSMSGANRIIEIEPPAFYKRKLTEADINNLTA